MSQDLPIYSETMLRTGLQFAGLEQFKGSDTTDVWKKSDQFIASLENASDLAIARASLTEISKDTLLGLHLILFRQRPEAGKLRTTELAALYRGQDCAPPQFIDRSLDNLMSWLSAESFRQIHPIERCAVTMARIIDVWPFEFGNVTTAIVFGNTALKEAGLTPFYVQSEHKEEFEKVIAQAMTIDMQPLVNAIYKTVLKEMEALGKR
jgi:fido (protein-threonine AMPylation protein)